MNRMELLSGVNADRSLAIIELRMNGQALGHIELAAAELEGFIHQLAGARAAMAEQVPVELETGARLANMAIAPNWRVGENPDLGKALAVRHPGFGWLNFTFPQGDADLLEGFLLKR